jgi:glycosyltransferase involved in cell wall biosynthesis
VRRHYRRYLPLFPTAIERLDLTSYDLVISTSHCVAKGVVTAPQSRHLCYCHTPMRYAWDQQHAYFPKRTGALARIRDLILSRLRAWDVASAKRVDRFVANSSFVAGRIERYYGRQAEVIHPPVDTEFFRPTNTDDPGSPGLDSDKPQPQQYALVVSALAPYKRIEVAIAATKKAGIALSIVGEGPERERLEQIGGDHVTLHGQVEAESLRRLYRGAAVFLQPGVEDFGIAPVEALACGRPVVALGQGGVLDIVEDGVHGVLYRGEGDADSMAAAIDKCLQVSFNSLNLRERAETFSAERFDHHLRELLESEGPAR